MNQKNESVNAETKSLVKTLLEEKNRDILSEVAPVEIKILATWDEFEKHDRLRHTGERAALWFKLENLYVDQAAPRKNQMQREEEIKASIKKLNQPIVDKWIKDLFEDNTELLSRRSAVGDVGNKLFDRVTGIPMLEISHNLADASKASMKILEAIRNLREGMDCRDLEGLEKVYLKGHEIVNSKLRTETIVSDARGYDDLLATLKTERPRLDELTGVELSAVASAERTIGFLESLKKEF